MTKPYESLMGAIARSVFYRPERQRVRELLSRDARPLLLVNGHEFPLFDISMNGLSFLAPGEPSEWEVNQEIEMTLLLHGQQVYRGSARVARTEQGPRGARIGIGLTTGFLDLPAIRRQDDENRLERELENGPAVQYGLVPKSYREEMNRAAHFLGYYRRSLENHEQRYRLDTVNDGGREVLVERAYEAIREPWWEINVAASRAAMECLGNREVLIAAKEYTEALVTPFVLDSAIGSRSYAKPLGYAGDFQIMLYFYSNSFEGSSVLGKVIHKFYVDRHPLGRGVRSRKDLLVQLMEEEHHRLLSVDETATFRVVSLGCGPAREVSDFIGKNRNWSGSVLWTLIDPEEDALSVAYRECRREIGRWGSRAHLNLLNLSFVQLMAEGIPLQEPESQHFIYSAGLFDYLRESRARKLLRGFYDLLAPGGLIAIGNAVAPNEFFWNMEFLVDWTLFYRSREEMLGLADQLPETAQVEVVLEPEQGYFFLLVRKH